jgi:hypothetical protein
MQQVKESDPSQKRKESIQIVISLLAANSKGIHFNKT